MRRNIIAMLPHLWDCFATSFLAPLIWWRNGALKRKRCQAFWGWVQIYYVINEALLTDSKLTITFNSTMIKAVVHLCNLRISFLFLHSLGLGCKDPYRHDRAQPDLADSSSFLSYRISFWKWQQFLVLFHFE